MRFERSPIKVGVDLPGCYQMLQLLEPSEPSKEEHFLRHLHSLEDPVQLAGAKLGRPSASESRKVALDLGKGGAVATVIAARRTKSHRAAVEDLPDNIGYFAYAVILCVVSDVENLV